MSPSERNPSAPIDPVKLDRLAQVAVQVGLRLERGQDLLVTADRATRRNALAVLNAFLMQLDTGSATPD